MQGNHVVGINQNLQGQTPRLSRNGLKQDAASGKQQYNTNWCTSIILHTVPTHTVYICIQSVGMYRYIVSVANMAILSFANIGWSQYSCQNQYNIPK